MDQELAHLLPLVRDLDANRFLSLPMTNSRVSTLAEAIERLSGEGVTVAHVGIVDLFGSFRERRLPIGDVGSVSDGGGTFVNVLPQWSAAEQVFGGGPFVGEPVAVDPGSIRRYPFEPDACMMTADYLGPSAGFSPRGLLKRQVDKAAAMGFEVRTAFESEFIVLDEDQTSLRDSAFQRLRAYAEDNRCWSGESAATHADFIGALEDVLTRGDISLQSLSLELGPGCFEVTLRHDAPLKAADDMIALKLFTKAFCRERGKTASFMAQLDADSPGLSQHPHLSLSDPQTGENLFGDNGDGRPNKLMAQFVAGMLAMIPTGMPLTHHNVNAYRRHAPGNWAPKSATWAVQNYSAAIRAVLAPQDRARIEYRLPGADAHPYLNLAFILGAGLWGIERGLEPGAPLSGGGPDDSGVADAILPHDLFSAIAAMRHCENAREIWGEPFISQFTTALEQEDIALRTAVSGAERKRYLELL